VIPYPRYDGEYEVANWYTSTHPDALFRNVIAARPLPNGGRLTMFNASVTRRRADGQSERRVLESPDEFASVLREEFGLELSDEEMAAIVPVARQRGARETPHAVFV
jgi:N-hydroxyarylamine O-acetyltransferase